MKRVSCFITLILFLCQSVFVIADDESLEKKTNILLYGLDDEIIALIDELEKNGDSSFDGDLKNVFLKAKNNAIRERILRYYTSVKYDGLASYAEEILSDPYDEKKSTVEALIRYAAALNLSECAPHLRKLLDEDNETYMTACITALGSIGGAEDAVFLAEYLERDIPIQARQELLKSLGKLGALETWDALREIAENEDENLFVRMYAAEAIGAMKKKEAVPVLTRLFEESDPNLRIYALKGLAYFDDADAADVILQAFRDPYYKVRLEAAQCAQTLNLKDAEPYLLYRAKNDPEQTVRLRCYEVLAEIGGTKSNEFFLDVFENEKTADVYRIKAAKCLLQRAFDDGYPKIETFLLEALNDDKKKTVRYEISKLLTDVNDPALEPLCAAYLSHKDIIMKNFGVDIYASNKFPSLTAAVESLARDKKNASLQKKARRSLDGFDAGDEDDEDDLSGAR